MRTTSCETHLSRLFFSENRVYKLLKSVRLPFVDFTDTIRRLEAASVEFELNHRISPDVYLGLADIIEEDELADRMIVMRRLNEEEEFGHLLETGLPPDSVREVARAIARLHADLEPLRGSAAEPATPEAIEANWEDNFAAIMPHVGDFIDEAEFEQCVRLVRGYCAGRRPLFESRIESGWVRDGHGDLRAEHIYCTGDGPRFIDCVAFDRRLRVADALSDVAFLAMDADRLAGRHVAVELMRFWNEFTNEGHPSSLAHFYVAYRAHVRCKVACFQHQDGDPAAASVAAAYHAQALHHLENARVRLIMVGGGAGAGKSTIAGAVGDALGAVWLRADEIRKDVAGLGHEEHDFAEPGQGIYCPEITAATQAEIRRQARLLLDQGLSVVVDATFRDAASRDPLRALGAECHATTTELQCDLPRAMARERIARRMSSLYNPSDATPELVDFIADQFEDWPEATIIDTSGAIASTVAHAIAATVSPGRTGPATPTPHRFEVDVTRLRNQILISEGIRRTASETYQDRWSGTFDPGTD